MIENASEPFQKPFLSPKNCAGFINIFACKYSLDSTTLLHASAKRFGVIEDNKTLLAKTHYYEIHCCCCK